MTPEIAKRLLDARNAAVELEEFIEGHTAESFDDNRGLQLIVHKLLEIIGEALNGARRSEPSVAQQIPNLQRYISLRNQITHGYDSVDYSILWVVARSRIPDLIVILDELLNAAESPDQET